MLSIFVKILSGFRFSFVFFVCKTAITNIFCVEKFENNLTDAWKVWKSVTGKSTIVSHQSYIY